MVRKRYQPIQCGCWSPFLMVFWFLLAFLSFVINPALLLLHLQKFQFTSTVYAFEALHLWCFHKSQSLPACFHFPSVHLHLRQSEKKKKEKKTADKSYRAPPFNYETSLDQAGTEILNQLSYRMYLINAITLAMSLISPAEDSDLSGYYSWISEHYWHYLWMMFDKVFFWYRISPWINE